jgi:hypothetical protein
MPMPPQKKHKCPKLAAEEPTLQQILLHQSIVAAFIAGLLIGGIIFCLCNAVSFLIFWQTQQVAVGPQSGSEPRPPRVHGPQAMPLETAL